MSKEIERKFLVKNRNYLTLSNKKWHIAQGYLNDDPSRTVRIRTKNDKAFITIKGIGNASGMTRGEWEYEIPITEAHELLNLCKNPPIIKSRYEVIYKDLLFEIDEFEGENEGLIIAEVELINEEHEFEFPDWLGEEVTGNVRFYNSYISTNPYKNW